MGFFSIYPGENRIFGLDLLRFFAIFFVLLGHSIILLPDAWKNVARMFILDGVGIFFVLSGFLIGQILLKQINRGETAFKNLLRFWSRRWMRTLPAYFVVLTFLLVITAYLRPGFIPEKWYKYYFFVQNFNAVQPSFFQESWSLSIEEWFYLLVPALFFSVLYFLKKQFRNTVLFLVLVFIIGILAYRFLLFRTYSGPDFQTDILLQIIPRLDGIMVGVLGACCTVYFPELWKRFGHWAWFAEMFVLLFVFKFLNTTDESLYYCVFAPTLKAFCVLFMLPFLSNWKIETPNFLVKSITFVSITSYSLYLINRTIVIDLVIKYALHGKTSQKYLAGDYWFLEYFLFWGLSAVFAFLLYKGIERPFLRLRDRS